MESGLEGRNNWKTILFSAQSGKVVSMESGLEGRNNLNLGEVDILDIDGVSMESGLEGRNNCASGWARAWLAQSQWSPA